MANWLIPVKYTTFNMKDAYDDNVVLFWGKYDNKYKVDDIIYFYVTKPIGKIMYKYKVTGFAGNHLYPKDQEKYWIEHKELQGYQKEYFLIKPMERIDKETLSLDYLKKNNLISIKDTLQAHRTDRDKAPNDPIRIVLDHIFHEFENNTPETDYPDEADTGNTHFPEGGKIQATVNYYERSTEARAECLIKNGTRCKVCDMSFAETYGYFAKDFIHVHHIKPLHEIGEEYRVNGKDDLIPVCPNCHAMLHKKENGIPMTVERLKLLFELSKNK